MTTILELEAALTKCRADELTCFVSFYGKRVSVSLTKHAFTGGSSTEFNVKGEGDTVTEAFRMAFNNFPKNPLDGASKWKSDRLPMPGDEPVDGQFTETSDADRK